MVGVWIMENWDKHLPYFTIIKLHYWWEFIIGFIFFAIKMGTMHELTQYPSRHSLGALEGCNLWSWRSWGWVKAIFMRSKMINHGILMDFGLLGFPIPRQASDHSILFLTLATSVH